jgi:DNA modification methylase
MRDSRAKIYVGDCLHAAKIMEPVDLLFTDPPANPTGLKGDNVAWLKKRLDAFSEIAKCIVFKYRGTVGLIEKVQREFSPLHMVKWEHPKSLQIWLGPDRWEPIWVIKGEPIKPLPATFVSPEHGAESEHPGACPPSVAEFVIEHFTQEIEHFTQEGDTVFDPYMGSGSVLVGAARRGRKGVGCEIVTKWTDYATHRLEQETILVELIPLGDQPEASDQRIFHTD